jgi:cleavage stimulation factor subunit 3
LDNLRKIYQKATSNPIYGVENIWRDYDTFENGLNRLTAKKILSERSGAYMMARSVYKERRILFDQINRNIWSRPPWGTEKEEQQLYAWKNLIAWEKRNPLKLEDLIVVQERVIFVYRQSLMSLRFYPEIWYDLANYLAECGRNKEAADFLAQGTEVLPNK